MRLDPWAVVWLLVAVCIALAFCMYVPGCAAPPTGCGPWITDPAEAGYVEVSPHNWVCPELVE